MTHEGTDGYREQTTYMFINGQAMTGGPLHDALADASLLGRVQTAPAYRFYSVRDVFPGLYPVQEGGRAVPGELYEVTYELLRERLLPREPEELELTVIELSYGQGSCLSMRMREAALSLPDVTDISDAGGWESYLASRRAGCAVSDNASTG